MKEQNLEREKQTMEGNSGITLIALIITIIVLLILAVVAISAVNNTGIIQHAQNSADEYTDKRDKENALVGNYLGIINHYKPKEDNTNPSEEEILWTFVDWGDGEYELSFIGNVEKLDLSQDREVKAYVASFNDDTEELEYDESSEITTIKLSDVTSIYMYDGSIKNLILGQVVKEKIKQIDGWGVKTLSVLGSFGDIPTRFCSEESVLENIIIGEGVKNIAATAFSQCKSLKSLTLPSTLETIGRHAFSGCSNLEDIILPGKISSIEEYAFGNCTNLTNITIKKPQGSLDLTNSGLTPEQIASVVWSPEE